MPSNTSQNSCVLIEQSQSNDCHIVWLDKNMNKHDNQRTLKKLIELDPNIESFTSTEDFITYIRKQNAEHTTLHIIFIVSRSLIGEIISVVENYRSIIGIFIFCKSLENLEHFQCDKIQEICTDGDELMNSIDMFLLRYHTTTDFSILPDQIGTHSDSLSSDYVINNQSPILTLKEDQARFLWFNRMHQFMVTLENEDDEIAKQEMIRLSRQQFKGKSYLLSKIDEFNSQLLIEDKERAIFSYTENSFIYQCVNTALRKENVSQVYSYRYIIKLICRQLKEQHVKFVEKYNKKQKSRFLRLYRGQCLKFEDLQRLTANIKNLMSLNGFISTTTNKDVALVFLEQNLQKDMERVLMRINIDMTIEHSVAFADIRNFSKYRSEKEVLLSIGSIFRVESVDFDDELEVYVVHLSLIPSDSLTVIKYLEQTYASNVDLEDQSVLFGKLLFEMGEYESAVQYFLDGLDRIDDDNIRIRAAYLNNIGVCYNQLQKQELALDHYTEALQMYERANNIRGLGACQHNIASIYRSQKDYSRAEQWALKAFRNRPNKVDKASTVDLLGCIYLNSNNYEAAEDHFKRGLKLRVKYFKEINPHHPDIGVSYHNLGKVNEKQLKYREAQENYSKAAEIYAHNFPSTHPLVLEIDEYLNQIQKNCRH
ncbi:unnamed protein product [Rotaria socialis]